MARLMAKINTRAGDLSNTAIIGHNSFIDGPIRMGFVSFFLWHKIGFFRLLLNRNYTLGMAPDCPPSPDTDHPAQDGEDDIPSADSDE